MRRSIRLKNLPSGRLALAMAIASLLATSAAQVLAAPSGWLALDGSIQFIAANGGSFDWGNSGPGPAATCPTQPAVGGSGGLFTGGRCPVGTAPPTAPTLTAAAAADPSIISAVFLVDPIKGDSTACGANDNSTYSKAAKNGDQITSFQFGPSGPLAKDDLSNVYAVSHTRADGHPELYFAAERLDNNGDSHMDFEFLQSTVGVTATCTGTFTGHRTEGDLLFAVDFTGGGAIPGFAIYQWHCAADPGVQPPDGTVCDPTGVQHYESLGTPAFASLSVNSSATPCGGWVCRDKSGLTTTVAQNNFLEGAIDLQGLPLLGCINTMWPHTRTAQSFSSNLVDFAGPVNFKSCKDPATTSNSSPSGSGVAAVSTATDTVNVTNGGAGLDPAGTMTFFLCNPAQVSAAGCVSGGIQVGAVKPIVAGAATSDPTAPLQFNGRYCWRTNFAPNVSLAGVYEPATHTNGTTECFTVAGGATLPNTGVPILAKPRAPWAPVGALALIPVLAGTLAWRRPRAVAAVLVAGLVAGASAAPAPVVSPHAGPAAASDVLPVGAPPPSAAPELATVHAHDGVWRLVIPRIGVDAPIDPVGFDRAGAMAAPATLDRVGWFDRGPAPGHEGDAVIDGHLGLPAQPAVFRQLARLHPGDEVRVVWPNGHVTVFTVTGSQVVAADARPPDVFSRSGPARLTLITCSGAWDQAKSTYTDRLLVTAMLA